MKKVRIKFAKSLSEACAGYYLKINKILVARKLVLKIMFKHVLCRGETCAEGRGNNKNTI